MSTRSCPNDNARLLLASGSPRRQMLLRQAGLRFETLVTNVAEDIPPGSRVEDVAVMLAERKAVAARAQREEPDLVVLAADTVVVLDDAIIGKPADDEEAYRILERLSNRTHRVITGVSIRGADRELHFSTTTEVRFYTLSPAEIRHYVARYKPLDKAGAYAIQEWIGLRGVREIRGDYYNVMGLPVSRTVKELVRFGDFSMDRPLS